MKTNNSLLIFACMLVFAALLLGCTDKVAPGAGPSIVGKPFTGAVDAKVTLVEFSDFQCPVCGRFYTTIKQMEQAYGPKVKFVYKHFPLRQIHQYAAKAAEASECANDQGKFFEYHDVLFQNQNALDIASLKQYATDMGLDRQKFDACLDGGSKSAVVATDVQEGTNLGIQGTPTFYINNKQYVGYMTFERLKILIDAELAK